MEQRYIPMREMETREIDGVPVIEGYFAVFGEEYELFPGATESIERGAFSDCINQDVRALYNHDTNIVLARCSAGTMSIKEDDRGLWGHIELDPEDTDAMNVYRRVKRRSIQGNSFGFSIEEEVRSEREDGSVHWTITKVNPLYEISPCTFPAYEGTSISARRKEFEEVTEEMRGRRLSVWKEKMKERLHNGTKGAAAEKAD